MIHQGMPETLAQFSPGCMGPKNVTSLLYHEILGSCFYSAYSHISDSFFFLLSKFRDVVTVHHTVQIQWVMSEVPSAGLTKTYTLHWILFHEVIIAEGQVSERETFFIRSFSWCYSEPAKSSRNPSTDGNGLWMKSSVTILDIFTED